MSTDNSSVKEKRLLLLDLNGTMIYRTEYPLRNAKPSLFVRSKYTYVRIGSPKFVQKMSQYFTVGVYSSVMSHNIEASLNAILPNWKRFISVVYDRNYNKKDPDPVKEWDTVRDMTKIWKPSSQFNSKNTILVDNESRKVQDCPENAIIVSQYEAADVENQVAGSLDGLEIYLERMAKSEEFQRDEFDVKKYLALNRFQSFQKQEEDVVISKLEALEIVKKTPSVEDFSQINMTQNVIRGSKFTYIGEKGLRLEGVFVDSDTIILTTQMQLGNLLKYRQECQLSVFKDDELIFPINK